MEFNDAFYSMISEFNTNNKRRYEKCQIKLYIKIFLNLRLLEKDTSDDGTEDLCCYEVSRNKMLQRSEGAFVENLLCFNS
uniref:hypothetical protein n=1 Tax=Acinetobacter baumannii TaxID=470 RepID=UPI001C06642E